MSGTYVFPDTSERDCLNVVIQYEFTSRHNVRFYEGLWETCRGHRATVVQTNGYNNDENYLAHKNNHPWFSSVLFEQQECRKEITQYRTENYDTFCSDTKNWKIYKQMTYLLPSLLVTQGDVVVVFDFWRLNDFFCNTSCFLAIFLILQTTILHTDQNIQKLYRLRSLSVQENSMQIRKLSKISFAGMNDSP